MADVDSGELWSRTQVVLVAQAILAGGAHYLWGAQGNGQVGMASNTFGPPDENYRVLAALAGGFVCAGRPEHPDVTALQRWAGSASDLINFDPTGYSFPRYWKDGDTANPSSPGMFYGENCQGAVHFDCAGFVRHCFRQVLGAASIPVSGLIMRDKAKLVWGIDTNGGAIIDADILPADLLYTRAKNHVGLATGGSAYNTSGQLTPDNAIHAFNAKKGVIMTPVDGSANPDGLAVGWSYVYRWTQW
jgi:hypothetical protein